MKVLRILIVAAVLLAAFTQLQAQPAVETLNVDTLAYLGKTQNGEAAGAFFLPDGNIIVAWKNAPVIIDKNTGEILRKLESVESPNLRIPQLSKDGRYFIASSDAGKKVWDVATGKIIKQLKLGEFCLSKDGTKMYCSVPNDTKDPGIIIEYDMNTLERIDRFCDNGLEGANWIAISPDGQTIAVAVDKEPNNEYDKKTTQVILIDLKDKTKYTVLETLEPQVYSMEFSPDGKKIAFAYGGVSPNIYIYIYNLETKVKKFIKLSEIQNIIGPNSSFGKPKFLNDKILLFTSSMQGNPYDKDITVTWDIEQNALKNIIMFYAPYIDLKADKLLLCSWNGAIALTDTEYVSVKDNSINNQNYLTYINSQLEFNSDKSFLGQSTVYDTTGKMIANLGVQLFVIGKNIIRINQTLLKGVYLLTINDKTNQSSYKFIVE